MSECRVVLWIKWVVCICEKYRPSSASLVHAVRHEPKLEAPVTETVAFTVTVDQDQAAQHVQPDLSSTLSVVSEQRLEFATIFALL